MFENGKRALALAHALRASHSGGSPWVEQTRHFVFTVRGDHSEFVVSGDHSALIVSGDHSRLMVSGGSYTAGCFCPFKRFYVVSGCTARPDL